MPTSSFPSELLLAARWPVGGIRTHLGYNHAALIEAGYRCTLVVPDDETLTPLRETLPQAEFLPVVRQGKQCSLWRPLRSLVATGRFQAVHAHGMTAAAHAGLACLGQKVPFLVTLHEPLRQAQFAGLLGMSKRWLLGQVLAQAAAVIVVSQDSRQNLLHYFPNLRRHSSRIYTISNGIDTERFAEQSDQSSFTLRDELGLDDDTTLLGFLGRFMPEKGFPLLLDAIERLVRYGSVPPFHLVAFGSGDYRREYAATIEQRRLTRFVTLRDFVPDVRPVLEQLDLVVTPSLWEASSLISMEALCVGVPVLGSNCPGLREVLHGTPSRMVETGSVTALETGLREALHNPWYDEASAYVTIARQRYDNRRSARQLVQVLADVIQTRRRLNYSFSFADR